MSQTLNIDITEELEDFNSHIKVNKNIILSAKFGNGKSYMLNEYKENYSDGTYFITLYPVNYTIAENEDILEYIKRDIIFQLLRDGYISDQTDFSAITKSLFTTENLKNAFSVIMNSADNSGLLAKGLELILKTKEKYDSEKKTVEKYQNYHQQQRGGLYEDDIYTQIIRAGLKQSCKETVLIIEDLDRVDPAHLFRLLNVFSTQCDRPYMNDNENARFSNKFGFDKTIMVLDYDQAENLYEHFYGNKAGYEGYMSKIMSSRPYKLDITKKAQDFLTNFIIKQTQTPYNAKEKELIDNHIKQLSVREIASILDRDPNQFLKYKHITIEDEKISSNCLATRSLFYLSLIKVTRDEYISIMNPNGKYKKKLIEIFAPFILFAKHNKNYEVRLYEKDIEQENYAKLSLNNGVIHIDFGTSYSFEKVTVEEDIKEAINLVFSHTFSKSYF